VKKKIWCEELSVDCLEWFKFLRSEWILFDCEDWSETSRYSEKAVREFVLTTGAEWLVKLCWGRPCALAELYVEFHQEWRMTRPTVCETWWGAIVSSFDRNYDTLIARHPDCAEDIALLRTALNTIGQLVHISPTVIGNGSVWKGLTAKVEAERAVLCKHLDGKALFTAMLHMYANLHRELRDSLLPKETTRGIPRAQKTKTNRLRKTGQEM
jgi:hypothetical protein